MSVRYEIQDHIATITIARPEALNSISLDTWTALSEATQKLEADKNVWVGIITGEGERAFSAGADLKTTVPALLEGKAPESPVLWRGQRITKPLIAAINGLALGGGLEIALSCDIRIAAEGVRLGLPEVGLGIIPDWGGTQRLPRQVPWAIAAQMIFTGEPITTADALRIGLINAVVPADRVMVEARRMAERICQMGPLAVQAAKRAMVEGSSMSLEDGLAFEREQFRSLAKTRDVQEGLTAFLEKRPPQFKGE